MRRSCQVFLAILLACVVPTTARPSGFQIFEQNARGIGSAFAGEAATAEDAGTVFYNPAGMTLLDGTQLVSAVDAVLTTAPFHDRGSTVNPTLGGAPLTGPNDNGGVSSVVPSFYLSQALGDRWRLGLGVGTPFGLRTEYDKGWVGRYLGVVSELRTINVNPSLAVRLNRWVSVGGGFDAQYAYAKLTNGVDLGGACQLTAIRAGGSAAGCTALGLTPQGADGYVRLRGEDWGYGWNAGVLVFAGEHTRFGLTYRSRVGHTLEGDAKFTVPPQAVVLRRLTGALRTTDASATATFPDFATLAAVHQLTPTLTLLADITWTHWELFRDLTFQFANPKQPAVREPESWDDAFRYALGLHWEPLRRWSFRIGTAYDETPVPSARFRTPRIPDSDRIWFALGAGWSPTERLRVDLGYAHVFGLNSTVDKPDPVTRNVLRGVYRSGGADVLGMQATVAVDWSVLIR